MNPAHKATHRYPAAPPGRGQWVSIAHWPDLREHGHGALPHIGLATVNDGTAIAVDLDHDGRAIPIPNRAITTDMHGRGHAHTTTHGTGLLGMTTPLIPANGLGTLVQAFLQPRTADLPAMDGYIPHLDGIDSMHINRIESQHAGHGVNMAVQSEQHLRATKPPKCAMRRRMGVSQACPGAYILQSMHVVTTHGRDMHHFM